MEIKPLQKPHPPDLLRSALAGQRGTRGAQGSCISSTMTLHGRHPPLHIALSRSVAQGQRNAFSAKDGDGAFRVCCRYGPRSACDSRTAPIRCGIRLSTTFTGFTTPRRSSASGRRRFEAVIESGTGIAGSPATSCQGVCHQQVAGSGSKLSRVSDGFRRSCTRPKRWSDLSGCLRRA